jgi:hypothetical protein
MHYKKIIFCERKRQGCDQDKGKEGPDACSPGNDYLSLHHLFDFLN